MCSSGSSVLIAFLKVSQKIDSFMASGDQCRNTGGNMLAELLMQAGALPEPSTDMAVAADTAGHPLLEAQPLAAAFSPAALPGRWDARYSGKPSMLLPH